jgi:hypothetical protein
MEPILSMYREPGFEGLLRGYAVENSELVFIAGHG